MVLSEKCQIHVLNPFEVLEDVTDQSIIILLKTVMNMLSIMVFDIV